MKYLFYRFSTTFLGKSMLKLLSFGVSPPYVKSQQTTQHNKANKKQFHVIITIDTEGGYVAPNEQRVWQKEAPDAFVGYYLGIKNIRAILKKHGIKSTFFLNTHCFSAEREERQKIISELKSLIKDGHEIGLHPHPDSDFALQKKLKRMFPATSCFFYEEKELSEILLASKQIIGEHLGKGAQKNIRSIRWGNWALNTNGAKAIAKNGITRDSSATPGISGHLNDSRKYDWSKALCSTPWNLSMKNYQLTTEKKSLVLEIPIAIFSFFGMKLRADPLYSELLKKAFVKYYYSADKSSGSFPFVVMTHSCEATMKNGEQTQALLDLDEFISFAKKFDNVKFSRIRDA